MSLFCLWILLRILSHLIIWNLKLNPGAAELVQCRLILLCSQALRPEFDPWSMCKCGRRDPTPQSGTLTATHVP